ncbi:uncharacterized protein E0L32_009840 [Thyridium curvatum]|uniref:3-hydroxyisobutyrate dehydrogenase n=1 Tax=Thyridium curvatum TaxID=1093900 RepID=A0A507AUR2_9PEZI|nr:uncharacterized protein E0L32_009840 [Thyridium curvatum]TPX08651.1 hypothetical protein E0L32_009840 [Thyridium curvatum]
MPTPKMRIGFLGLGIMGTPMALNMAREFPLIAWNRTACAKRTQLFESAGARMAKTPADVAEDAEIIFAMFADAKALQSVIASAGFRESLRGKTVVNTGTVSVKESRDIAAQIQHAGAAFVEMPVSGSKVPAEQAQLVGLVAGDEDVTHRIEPCVNLMTKATVYCGRDIGAALKMKYSVNLFMITMAVGLAEAVNFAKAQGLDLDAFARATEAGPLVSPYLKMKMPKLVNEDWTPQGHIKNCYHSNTRIIVEAARKEGVRTPLMDVCDDLFRKATEAGLGEEDMMAVIKTIAQSD